MARASDGQDYFINEPALAYLPQTSHPLPVLPDRFFLRDGQMMVSAHRLQADLSQSTFSILSKTEDDCLEIPLSSFVFSYPKFLERYQQYNLPSPANVSGK